MRANRGSAARALRLAACVLAPCVGLAACGGPPVEEPPVAEESATTSAIPPDPAYPGEVEAEGPLAVPEPAEEALAPEPPAAPPLVPARIFLVELEAGEAGEAAAAAQPGDSFGCGDRLRGVEVPVALEGLDTAGRIGAALGALLTPDGNQVPGGLYDSLASSELAVERVEAVQGVEGLYRVHLTGQLRLGGVCDHPRVEAQLTATARQFPGVDEVELLVDGQPLGALLTGR